MTRKMPVSWPCCSGHFFRDFASETCLRPYVVLCMCWSVCLFADGPVLSQGLTGVPPHKRGAYISTRQATLASYYNVAGDRQTSAPLGYLSFIVIAVLTTPMPMPMPLLPFFCYDLPFVLAVPSLSWCLVLLSRPRPSCSVTLGVKAWEEAEDFGRPSWGLVF